MIRFLRASWQDKWLLIKVFFVLNAVRLGLLALSFGTLRRLLDKVSSNNSSSDQAGQLPRERIIWAVEVATRYSPGSITCLPRALATHVLLLWHGYPATLRIGVAHAADGKLEAHAWVESQGEIVIGSLNDLSRYIPLALMNGGDTSLQIF